MQFIDNNSIKAPTPKQRTVLILFESLPQYRIEFYNLLQEKLRSENIILKLIFGGIPSDEEEENLQIKSAVFKKNKIIKVGPIKLIWQPCIKEIKEADLVIVQQASKFLINYVLLYRRMVGKQKFAFWGHGLNMQSSQNNVFNRFKRLYSNYTDWWFAYTPGVKSFLIKNGYKEEQITVVQNTLDTKQIIEDYKSTTDKEVADTRNQYNIKAGEKVLIYCGRLYKQKRMSFLIEAADKLIASGHSFKLFIIGAGADERVVKAAAATRPWLIAMGPQFGRQKALFFKLADIFLLPGAMGLAVLDSFALETPIVTTKYPYHGPEYEYLIDGYNGIVTNDNMEDYVKAVSDLMNDDERLNLLKRNCVLSGTQYSIENMAVNFVGGIKKIFQENTPK